MHANEDPLLYFAEEYTTETYRATYAEPLYPLSIEGLTPDLNVKPPILVKQRGRPKTKRIRKGQYARKKRRCGNCGQLATHNSRSCRAQPADIEGEEPESVETNLDVLQYRRQRMRTRRRDEQFDREMEELDQEIEVLQGQTEEVPGPHREFSPERSDSYVEP